MDIEKYIGYEINKENGQLQAKREVVSYEYDSVEVNVLAEELRNRLQPVSQLKVKIDGFDEEIQRMTEAREELATNYDDYFVKYEKEINVLQDKGVLDGIYSDLGILEEEIIEEE